MSKSTHQTSAKPTGKVGKNFRAAIGPTKLGTFVDQLTHSLVSRQFFNCRGRCSLPLWHDFSSDKLQDVAIFYKMSLLTAQKIFTNISVSWQIPHEIQLVSFEPVKQSAVLKSLIAFLYSLQYTPSQLMAQQPIDIKYYSLINPLQNNISKFETAKA